MANELNPAPTVEPSPLDAHRTSFVSPQDEANAMKALEDLFGSEESDDSGDTTDETEDKSTDDESSDEDDSSDDDAPGGDGDESTDDSGDESDESDDDSEDDGDDSDEESEDKKKEDSVAVQRSRLAKKERALRKREQEIQAQSAHITKEAEALAAFQQLLKTNPLKAATTLGLDVGELANAYVAGDYESADKNADNPLLSEVQALKAELATIKQATQTTTEQEHHKQELALISGSIKEEDYPFLYSSGHHDSPEELVYNTIQKQYEATGEVWTPEQAAQYANKRFEQLDKAAYERYMKRKGIETPPANKSSKKKGKTLSNNLVSQMFGKKTLDELTDKQREEYAVRLLTTEFPEE